MYLCTLQNLEKCKALLLQRPVTFTFNYLSFTLLFCHSLVTLGVELRANMLPQNYGGDGDNLISYDEARAVLLSAGYAAGTHPGFDPRSAKKKYKLARSPTSES